MISWQLKKISLRFIARGSGKASVEISYGRKSENWKDMEQMQDTWAHLFIVAQLQDDTEKLLYEFSGPVDKEIKEQLFELATNNTKALITFKDQSAPEILKAFAYVKMKNFRDVDIQIDEDAIPVPFGKYIGQDVKTLKKWYLKKMTNDNMEKYIQSFPKLREFFHR